MGRPRNLVLASIEAEGGGRWVELLRRAEETYVYEVYRRDSEDGRVWYMIGSYGGEVYASEAEARAAAAKVVPWLPQALRR